MSGTSMAAPHVAGIVALLAEAHPHASPVELKNLLLGSARALPLPSTDVGSGLVQAP
jgi:subtilisin family serine protease